MTSLTQTFQILKGAVDQSLYIFVQDSSVTTGAGLTGLAFNTASLVCYYVRPLGNAAQLSLVTQTVTGAHTDGGFVEVDATNMPGVYRLDLSDAIVASGVNNVLVMLKGAANMSPVLVGIQLTAINLQDSVRAGMTALPNAAAAASGGLPTVDSANSVKMQSGVKKNIARNNFEFTMRTTSGAYATGLTVTATRSIDGGAFAACTNSVTEVSNGTYKISLSAADLNGDTVTFRFSASGALDTFVAVIPAP